MTIIKYRPEAFGRIRVYAVVLMLMPLLAFFVPGCALTKGLLSRPESPVNEGRIETASPTDSGRYHIGPEDTLMISVWKDPELTREVVVRPDGRISFPLIGEVEAGGKTVPDLEETLISRIREYVPGARLTVMVTRVNNYRIYVIGKVGRPGEYRPGYDINVMQALSLAGGLTPFADKNDILILNNENRPQTAIPFDYNEVKKGKKLEQNLMLKTGDIVVVP